jgi:hypothetical protein
MHTHTHMCSPKPSRWEFTGVRNHKCRVFTTCYDGVEFSAWTTMPGRQHALLNRNASGWSRICNAKFMFHQVSPVLEKIHECANWIITQRKKINKTCRKAKQHTVLCSDIENQPYSICSATNGTWCPALRKAGLTEKIYLFCFLLTCTARLPSQLEKNQKLFRKLMRGVFILFHTIHLAFSCFKTHGRCCQSHLIRWIRMMNHSGAVC